MILRYEIEQQLISSELAVADLPSAWTAKMSQFSCFSTETDFTDDCVQAYHWLARLFGSFPTYTLDDLVAAQLVDSTQSKTPGLLDGISQGDSSPLLNWLRANVHGQGKNLSFDQLMVNATVEMLDARFFKSHLEARYS